MMKKILLVLISGMLLLTGCGKTEPVENPHSHDILYFDNGMQKFPSYDWGAEDADALAMISANTGGSDIDKQKAVLYALDRVWYHDHLSLPEWAWRNYELYNSPTERDYELVSMVIFGEWAED